MKNLTIIIIMATILSGCTGLDSLVKDERYQHYYTAIQQMAQRPIAAVTVDGDGRVNGFYVYPQLAVHPPGDPTVVRLVKALAPVAIAWKGLDVIEGIAAQKGSYQSQGGDINVNNAVEAGDGRAILGSESIAETETVSEAVTTTTTEVLK